VDKAKRSPPFFIDLNFSAQKIALDFFGLAPYIAQNRLILSSNRQEHYFSFLAPWGLDKRDLFLYINKDR